MVHGHTYYLAAQDRTLGAHPMLGPALKRVWRAHRLTDTCAYYEGASVWFDHGLHLCVVRSSPTHPSAVEVLDLDPKSLAPLQTAASA